MPYKLSATLLGHTQDVRAVSSTADGGLVLSASRDGTARSWKGRTGTGWTCETVFGGHTDFVNAIGSARMADGTPFVVTGSKDATLLVWPAETAPGQQPEPLRTLIGHVGVVCAIDTADDDGPVRGWIASGSWDTTARLWNVDDPSGEAIFTLQGSELSIWAVKIISNASTPDAILTLAASADKTIRLYSNDQHIQTFKGHTQPVRALTLLPASTGNNVFASSGNDGNVMIWDWKTGDHLRTLNGHDSFVYSLACTPDGTLASSGEDRSVRIWNRLTGDVDQIITIPAISIWSIAVLKDGSSDLIVGSSDNCVRIFTQDPARYAPPEAIKEFEELVSASAITANQIGDVKKTDLPDADSLKGRTGKKEGEIAMAKTVGGDVEAYQWSSAEGKWVKIGQVVDAVGSGRRQLYEGQEYDYVFDVDVAEGQPPLKLPFNVTQNPYEAAEKFLLRNDLPASYVDQVVQFIEKNTAGQTLGQSGAAGGDPYTGSSSYRRAPPANNTNATFTSDPWGSSASAPSAASSSLLPHKTFLTFPQANLAAALKKVFDLNAKLANDTSTATEFPLDSADTITLQSAVSSCTSSPASFSVDNATTTVLEKLLDWPSSHRFPVIDIVRIFALHAPVTSLAFQLLANLTPNPAATAKENETNAMLALRALANMLTKGKQGMAEAAPEILETLSVVGLDGLNKNGKAAFATVALNYSIVLYEGLLAPSSATLLVEVLEKTMADDDAETQYRSMIAFGNVLYTAPEQRSAIPASALQGLRARAEAIAKRGEQRFKDLFTAISQKKP